MITHVGDMSNLILDPDLNTYYLMDVTLLALPDFQDKLEEFIYYINQNASNKNFNLQEMSKLNTYVNNLRNMYMQRILSSSKTALQEDKNSFGGTLSPKKEIEDSQDEIRDILENILILSENKNNFTQKDIQEINLLSKELFKKVFTFQDLCISELNKGLNLRINLYYENIFYSCLIVFVFIIFSLFVSFYLIKGIIKPLSEIFNNLNKEANILNKNSLKTKDISELIASSTNQQDKFANDTACSMTEIQSMCESTSTLTQDSNVLVHEIVKKTRLGKLLVENMLESMNEIDASSNRLKEINNIIVEIEKNTSVINEIVSETRLLSFNASIEAARAGSSGKGFAVVAEEVGKLASVSGKSADEIKTLLENSRSKILDILNLTINKIQDGRVRAKEVSASFKDIEEGVEQTLFKIESISNATKEQSKGVSQIAKVLTQLENLTKRNLNSSQTSYSLSIEIKKSADMITVLAEKIRKIIFGGK